MEICEDTGSEAYLTLLHALSSGHRDVRRVAPRGQETHELLNVTLRITDPGEVHVLRTLRKPNLKIAATEAMHLVGGLSSLEQLDLASGSRFSQFANGGRLLGAYGPRAHRQLLAVEALLKRDPDSRQAVVSLWTGGEHDVTSRDVPCTTTLQFFIRGGSLQLRVTMRSNDAWLGLPYDLMMFSCLQRTMACALGVEPGEYAHSVGSMHLYERDANAAYGIIHDTMDREVSDPLVRVGIPVPLLHIEHRTFQDLATNAAAICLDGTSGFELPGWLAESADWLRRHVPRLNPSNYLCPGCRYVYPKGFCPSCDQEIW